eukprot:scaffold897_cov402-Prasinococcus_capsulatus_cf.AAC.47
MHAAREGFSNVVHGLQAPQWPPRPRGRRLGVCLSFRWSQGLFQGAPRRDGRSVAEESICTGVRAMASARATLADARFRAPC